MTNFDRAAAADAFLPKGACTPAEVLDRIRILVARKRGPKKQVQSVAVSGAGAGRDGELSAIGGPSAEVVGWGYATTDSLVEGLLGV